MRRKRLYADFLILLVSILVAIFILEESFIKQFIYSLGDYRWLGIFISGMFFTSLITTAPSIALLSEFAQTTPIFPMALIGGLGAVVGDYIIFRFIKDRVSKDVEYLFSFSQKKRFKQIFKTHLFKFLVPFIGALIIASPLPDEMGIAMMGISKTKDKYFLLISFVMNSLGIYIIGFVSKLLVL